MSAAVVAGIEIPGSPDTMTGRGVSSAARRMSTRADRSARRDQHDIRPQRRQPLRQAREVDATHGVLTEAAARQRRLLLSAD